MYVADTRKRKGNSGVSLYVIKKVKKKDNQEPKLFSNCFPQERKKDPRLQATTTIYFPQISKLPAKTYY